LAFRLTEFAGVALPPFNWTADFSTPLTRNPVVPTLNGYIDFYGVRRRIDCAQEFELDCEPDPTSVQATIRTLKRLVGRTGYLLRVNVDGSGTLQRYCRLLWVGFLPKAMQRGIVNKLTMRFWSNEPFWRATTLTTHGPTAISSGSNINLSITGEEDVIDAMLTIAADANISSIDVRHAKSENGQTIVSRFQKTNQLNSGTSWLVNCGQYTAQVGSSDDYANFALHAEHNELYWLRLPAGLNTLVITLGSGSGTWTLSYAAQYQ